VINRFFPQHGCHPERSEGSGCLIALLYCLRTQTPRSLALLGMTTVGDSSGQFVLGMTVGGGYCKSRQFAPTPISTNSGTVRA
jgi:hypothetical protein